MVSGVGKNAGGWGRVGVSLSSLEAGKREELIWI